MSGSTSSTRRGVIEVLSLDGWTIGGVRAANSVEAAALLERQMVESVGRVMEQVQADMAVTMRRVVKDLSDRHGKRWPLSGNLWGTVPDRLASRSGAGLESIKRSIAVGRIGDSEVIGSISTGRLTVHETGATIRARGKFLTLPLRAALDARGVARGPARSFQNTFVARGPNGGLMIFQRLGQDRIVPLFLLRKQVTIRPRLRLAETVDYETGYFASKAIEAMAKEFGL